MCADRPVPVTGDLHYARGTVYVADDLAHGRDADAAPGERVLDALDGRCELRLDVAALEGEVAPFHAAVHQAQALAVAERLRALDEAVLEGDVLAVPTEVLATHHGVAHHDVSCVPEGVLGVELAVFDHRVLDVLK